MKPKFILLSTFLALLLLSGIVLAQGDYQITQWAITGIAGQPRGNDYILSSTISQSDATELAGEDYTLTGGIVAGDNTMEAIANNLLFLPTLHR